MKPVPKIDIAQSWHIRHIVENVREADRIELWAAACMTPGDVLLESLRRAEEAYTGLVDDIPVCMFGVMNGAPMSGVGIPWMVGTKHLDKYAVLFLRRCGPVVEAMADHYKVLRNYVDARNTRAIRWLQWLGFEIQEAVPYGPFHLPFHPFEMRGNHV